LQERGLEKTASLSKKRQHIKAPLISVVDDDWSVVEVGSVRGKRIALGGGLFKLVPIASHRLSDRRCTHVLDEASNYSAGCLRGTTEFRSFSSLHMIVTMFISERPRIAGGGHMVAE
jgi:hypothetical protein